MTPHVVALGNALVAAALIVNWLSPILLFWAAAWGLRPFASGPGDNAPSWLAFGLAFTACFLPCMLPRAYYDRLGGPWVFRIYEAIGIRAFRALVTNGDYINRAARRADPGYRVVRDANAARAFAIGLENGERWHLVMLCMSVATAAYAAHIGWFGWAAAIMAINLVLHVYPIMLLRYSRARLRRISLRWHRRSQSGETEN